MILLVDNYDSFTFNLYQYLRELGAEVQVTRNDHIDIAQLDNDIDTGRIDRIVISPGPCTPREAGASVPIIERYGVKVPILGVCLGHQSIGAAYGARVIRADVPMHGKLSTIYHREIGVFSGLPNPFEATRYHSLIVERSSLPASLEVTAETADGIIMGLRHRELRVEGVQFHPESILTSVGKDLLANFLDRRPATATLPHARDAAEPAVIGY